MWVFSVFNSGNWLLLGRGFEFHCRECPVVARFPDIVDGYISGYILWYCCIGIYCRIYYDYFHTVNCCVTVWDSLRSNDLAYGNIGMCELWLLCEMNLPIEFHLCCLLPDFDQWNYCDCDYWQIWTLNYVPLLANSMALCNSDNLWISSDFLFIACYSSGSFTLLVNANMS